MASAGQWGKPGGFRDPGGHLLADTQGWEEVVGCDWQERLGGLDGRAGQVVIS